MQGAGKKEAQLHNQCKEVAAVEVKGKFDVQRFFDTLALILSERENVKITVKVTQREKDRTEETYRGTENKCS